MDTENRHGYSSISRKRIPDLVLEFCSDGENVEFICLDSKYTSSKSGILDSMASAHIYHDSIKRNGESPRRSLILVPANPSTEILASTNYIENYYVGCLTLSNAVDAKSIVVSLMAVLEIVKI